MKDSKYRRKVKQFRGEQTYLAPLGEEYICLTVIFDKNILLMRPLFHPKYKNVKKAVKQPFSVKTYLFLMQ